MLTAHLDRLKDCRRVTFHVKRLGWVPHSGLRTLGFVFRDPLADGRAGIVEVTGDNGVRGTDHHASRLQTDFLRCDASNNDIWPWCHCSDLSKWHRRDMLAYRLYNRCRPIDQTPQSHLRACTSPLLDRFQRRAVFRSGYSGSLENDVCFRGK